MHTIAEPQAPRRLMLPEPPPPSPRTRPWLRLSLLAGVALLTASLVGAGHVLNSHPNTGEATNGKAGAERTFSGPPGVIFLGTVDLLNTPGGYVALAPLQPGEIVEMAVTDTQAVKKGDVLLKVNDQMQAQTVAQAETGVRLAQAQLAQAQQAVASFQAGVDAQKAAVDAAKHKIAAADYRLRHQRFLKDSLGQSNNDEINAATEELDSAKSAQAAEEAKLRAFQANKPDVKVREAEANVTLAGQRVEQARLAVKQCTLEAPADGTVVRVAAAKGTVLGPQSRQAPVWFAPNGRVVVRGEVEQEFAHRVQAGMTAVITDEANGQGSWQGRVTRLGTAYLPKRSAGGPESFALGGSETRVLECLVELDPGQPMPLLGERVRVSVGTHGGS